MLSTARRYTYLRQHKAVVASSVKPGTQQIQIPSKLYSTQGPALVDMAPKNIDITVKPSFIALTQKNPTNNPARAFNFNFTWLRHNCNSPKNLHPDTGERIIDPVDIRKDISPEKVEAQRDGLTIVWNDAHESLYNWEWLSSYASAQKLSSLKCDPDSVTIDFAAMDNAKYKDLLGKHLTEDGIAIVKNRGLDTEAVILDFVESRDKVFKSHFGVIEDLMHFSQNTTNENTDQLGYTNDAVDVHTDQPFIEAPPRYQMLHCIKKADKGGDNMFVDVKKVVSHLKESDPLTLNTLANTDVTFHRKQKNFESVKVAPVLSLDVQGELKQIRYSYFTMAPLKKPLAVVEAWYEAYIKFTKLVRDPENQYRCDLNPGEFVVYDNYKMLHGRNAFSGNRHLRGVYYEEDNLHPEISKKQQKSHKQ